MMLMPRASNDDVTKRVDILVSIAMHYGKTFIPPLGVSRATRQRHSKTSSTGDENDLDATKLITQCAAPTF